MGVQGQQQAGRSLHRACIFSMLCRWGPLRTVSAWGLGGDLWTGVCPPLHCVPSLAHEGQTAAPRLMTRKPGPARSHPVSEVTQPCEGRGV